MIPDPRWRRGRERGQDSALGTLSPVLVGRDFHRGHDLLAAGQEGHKASADQEAGDGGGGETHVAASQEAGDGRGDGREASRRADGGAAAAPDGGRGDDGADADGGAGCGGRYGREASRRASGGAGEDDADGDRDGGQSLPGRQCRPGRQPRRPWPRHRLGDGRRLGRRRGGIRGRNRRSGPDPDSGRGQQDVETPCDLGGAGLVVPHGWVGELGELVDNLIVILVLRVGIRPLLQNPVGLPRRYDAGGCRLGRRRWVGSSFRARGARRTPVDKTSALLA